MTDVSLVPQTSTYYPLWKFLQFFKRPPRCHPSPCKCKRTGEGKNIADRKAKTRDEENRLADNKTGDEVWVGILFVSAQEHQISDERRHSYDLHKLDLAYLTALRTSLWTRKPMISLVQSKYQTPVSLQYELIIIASRIWTQALRMRSEGDSVKEIINPKLGYQHTGKACSFL